MAGRLGASLAASTGVATASEVVKYLLAGADAVMTTSALLSHDLEYMSKLTDGLRAWMDQHEIATLADMRGMMSWKRNPDPTTYTRDNYLKILERYAST